MSFEKLLNHTCDIYHIIKAETSMGYGLPVSIAFNYPEIPDMISVPCHFGNARGNITIVQAEPYKEVSEQLKLSLSINTDVRLNDKIIDLNTGVSYIAEIPINIRNHHISVKIRREQEYL